MKPKATNSAISFKTLRQQIKADAQRLNAFAQAAPALTRRRTLALCFRPELLTLILYRLSHLCFSRRHFGLARVFFTVNLILHGASIQPRSTIGAGCLIVHSPGLVVDGHIGANATLFGHNIIQPDWQQGQWSALPVLGDHCTLCVKSTVLGPVTIAHHVTLAPFTLVNTDALDAHVTIRTSGERNRQFKTRHDALNPTSTQEEIFDQDAC